MIRAAIVDDHPALRAGLEAVLRAEPGIVPVGSAATVPEIWPLLQRTKPDVIVLDYHIPPEDGLLVCQQIKEQLLAPKVLLYTAYASSSLAIPAAVAGADGVLSKGVEARELYEAIRRVSRGQPVGAPVPPELLQDAQAQLEAEHLPVLDGLLRGEAPAAVASAIGTDVTTVRALARDILRRLRVAVPEVSA